MIMDSLEVMYGTLVTELSEKGWSHLKTDVDPLDIVAVKGLLQSLGQKLTVDTSVQPELSVIAPRLSTGTLANTTRSMSFHTDNVYLDYPCRSVALFCAIQADSGGGSEVVDGLEAAQSLTQEQQDILSNRIWSWKQPGHKVGSSEYAVLSGDKESIRWWRETLLNSELGSIAAANALEESLQGSSSRERLLMEPGDIFVVNNRRVLHSRDAFRGNRHMYRARYW